MTGTRCRHAWERVGRAPDFNGQRCALWRCQVCGQTWELFEDCLPSLGGGASIVRKGGDEIVTLRATAGLDMERAIGALATEVPGQVWDDVQAKWRAYRARTDVLIEKLAEAISASADFFNARDEMNAAVHTPSLLRLSPITVVVNEAMEAWRESA